jgi:hypothetical protein
MEMNDESSLLEDSIKIRLSEFSRWVLIWSVLLQTACAVPQKITQDKVREKIQQLGLVQVKDKDKEVQVERILQSGADEAIAETNLKVVFKFSKQRDGDWQISALRVGDRDWLDIKALLSALNEIKARQTRESLQKLLNGLKAFKEKTGNYPRVENIVKLTDILAPAFMSEVIRYDGWNRELIFDATRPDSFQLLSLGADGIRGTADDIVVSP